MTYYSLPARNMLSHEIAGIESAEKIVSLANLAFSREIVAALTGKMSPIRIILQVSAQ